MPIIHHWRCTRPDVYPLASYARRDPSARQGYYVDAETETEAHRKVQGRFPGERIDVTSWREHAS